MWFCPWRFLISRINTKPSWESPRTTLHHPTPTFLEAIEHRLTDGHDFRGQSQVNITQEPGPDSVSFLTSLPLAQELCQDT